MSFEDRFMQNAINKGFINPYVDLNKNININENKNEKVSVFQDNNSEVKLQTKDDITPYCDEEKIKRLKKELKREKIREYQDQGEAKYGKNSIFSGFKFIRTKRHF